METGHSRLLRPAPFAVLLGAVALIALLPGLSAAGFSSPAELPVVNRSLAALGAPLGELERSPWLPDALRTWSISLLADGTSLEFAARLPHVLAAAALVGLTGGAARALGVPPVLAALAACFALAFPAVTMSARTVLGNPFAELFTAGAVAAFWSASRSETPRRFMMLGGAALLCAAAGLSAGMVIGVALPVMVAAVVWPPQQPRLRAGLFAAALLVLAGGAYLGFHQGDGFIPALGAAKHLELLEDSTSRGFAMALERLGYQLFPWAPLVVLAVALSPRKIMAKVLAPWLAVTMAIALPWSTIYGGALLGACVPAALACALFAESLWRGPALTRRLGLFAAILAMALIAADAGRTPSAVASPLFAFERESLFPGEQLDVAGVFKRLSRLAMAALLLSTILFPRPGSSGGPLSKLRLPVAARELMAAALLFAAAGFSTHMAVNVMSARQASALSMRGLFDTHRALVGRGELPARLGLHRVRDGGLALYGPAADQSTGLTSRHDIFKHLSDPQPAAALIHETEVPAVFQTARQDGWPLNVLSDEHATLRLVANVLPPGVADKNPIPAVVRSEPFELANETRVQFEDYVEVTGWELDGPLVRGSRRTIRVALRVLRPLPAGAKIYTRLQAGKTSRINAEPVPLTGKVYPPNYWRTGDYILHEQAFDVPVLEVLTGPHELVLGLRRTEKKNFEISAPTQKSGEFGVRLKNAKRTFAAVGEVKVW